MEFEEQHRIEKAIKVLPHVPVEYRQAQAARIAGWIYPQLRSWAPGIARKCGDARGQEVEDIGQVAAIAVLEALREYAAGEKHTKVRHWFPYLRRLVQFQVTGYYKSGAVTPMSGRTNLERRLARIPRTIDRLRHELLREPIAEEVVEALNAEMHRRQANPAKHGSLISVRDAHAFLQGAQ